FAEVRSGRVERAVIVHFEHFHPDNSSRFGYPPEPTAVLGGNTYLHQNWWLEADFFARPDIDSLLKHHALLVDTLHASDRHVRVVDEAAKHEVILFYLERSAL